MKDHAHPLICHQPHLCLFIDYRFSSFCVVKEQVILLFQYHIGYNTSKISRQLVAIFKILPSPNEYLVNRVIEDDYPHCKHPSY